MTTAVSIALRTECTVLSATVIEGNYNRDNSTSHFHKYICTESSKVTKHSSGPYIYFFTATGESYSGFFFNITSPSRYGVIAMYSSFANSARSP